MVIRSSSDGSDIASAASSGSAFRKLKTLYRQIEKAIIQHCESFAKGNGLCDLCRFEQDWK
jgi:hypothetical protein